jgi:hypothetical protein
MTGPNEVLKSSTGRRHQERRRHDAVLKVLVGVSATAMAIALAAAGLIIVVGNGVLSNRDDVVRAVCAIADYADSQVKAARTHPLPPTVPPEVRSRSQKSIDALDDLVANMRATGIDCRPGHQDRAGR